MHSHAARFAVPVHDAEIGCDREASILCNVSRDRCEVVRQRGHRKTVDVRSAILVRVGPSVPVTPEAQHAYAHRMSATNDRRIEPGLSRPELQTFRRNRALVAETQIMRKINGARSEDLGCDGHTLSLRDVSAW